MHIKTNPGNVSEIFIKKSYETPRITEGSTDSSSISTTEPIQKNVPTHKISSSNHKEFINSNRFSFRVMLSKIKSLITAFIPRASTEAQVQDYNIKLKELYSTGKQNNDNDISLSSGLSLEELFENYDCVEREQIIEEFKTFTLENKIEAIIDTSYEMSKKNNSFYFSKQLLDEQIYHTRLNHSYSEITEQAKEEYEDILNITDGITDQTKAAILKKLDTLIDPNKGVVLL